MEQKMKNFDRRIEQMMNESEVTPPFGMWNRIAAELETGATPIPVSVNSPIPQRTVFGFIAGALLISASLMIAYLLNGYSAEEKAIAVNTAVVSQPSETTTVVTEVPTIVFREEVRPAVIRSSKLKSIAKPAKEIVSSIQEPASAAQVIPAHAEVLIPNQPIAQSNGVTEPYYFPAIDINTTQNKTENKIVASVAKTVKTEKTSEEKGREIISSNDVPKIKFRPKKHRSFSYGRIIHSKKK